MKCINLFKRGEPMKVKAKRLALACLLSLGLVTAAGCGSSNVLDTYSFGHQVIQDGPSEINVALPFEIGVDRMATVDKETGNPISVHIGSTEHVLAMITGMQAGPGKTLASVDEYALHAMSLYVASGGTANQETVNLDGGASAKKITGSLYLQNGQENRFLQYVFIDNNVLWNIVYQYPVGDEVGAQVVQYIEDKIQVTPKKEG